MSKITIWCDGSSAGNPGPSGVAYIIRHDKDDGKTDMIGPIRHFVGVGTNQQAEILAAARALIYVLEHFGGNMEIEMITDSMYVVQSMKSLWVKKKNLQHWYILEAAAKDLNITWTHEKKGISAQNRMCDREANTAVHMRELKGGN